MLEYRTTISAMLTGDEKITGQSSFARVGVLVTTSTDADASTSTIV
jgi:hypothetical protein